MERRGANRNQPENDVTVTIFGSRPARLVNISADGALLEVTSALNPKLEYRLSLPLMDGPVRLRAKVTRCRLVGKTEAGAHGRPVYSVGVQFLGVDSKLAAAIEYSFPPAITRPEHRSLVEAKIDIRRLNDGHNGVV